MSSAVAAKIEADIAGGFLLWERCERYQVVRGINGVGGLGPAQNGR